MPPDPNWHCPACGSTQWVGYRFDNSWPPMTPARRQCVPCGHYSNDPVPEPTDAA